MVNFTSAEMQNLFNNARAAGDAAVAGQGDGWPCGFASLNIKPARGSFVKFLKEKSIGRPDSYLGGWTLSSYDCSAYRGQNMDVKTDGVDAFAKVIRAGGVDCTVGTRMD